MKYAKELNISDFRGVYMQDELPKKIWKKSVPNCQLQQKYRARDTLGTVL